MLPSWSTWSSITGATRQRVQRNRPGRPGALPAGSHRDLFELQHRDWYDLLTIFHPRTANACQFLTIRPVSCRQLISSLEPAVMKSPHQKAEVAVLALTRKLDGEDEPGWYSFSGARTRY